MQPGSGSLQGVPYPSGRPTVLSPLSSRLTYANVMSTIAVFVALGGGAYAAVALPKNSVGTRQLKADAVTSAKVRNHTLRAHDFAAGQLPAGAPGAAGGQGPQGAQGPVGAQGPAGPSTAPAPSEAWHEVGTPGEPAFLNGWGNPDDASAETVAFYKDREGTVHLKGVASGGDHDTLIFQLPVGYRPAAHKLLSFAVACECEVPDPNPGEPRGLPTSVPTGGLVILGSGLLTGDDGGVGRPELMVDGGAIGLSGITFRAEG
jgi:hypothetical protein